MEPNEIWDRPPHYMFGDVEVIDLVKHLNFCCGNAVKYVCRAGRKEGSDAIVDLRKAIKNLEFEIARLQQLRRA